MQIRITGTKTRPLTTMSRQRPVSTDSPTGSFLPPNLSGPFGATFTALQTVLPKAFAAVQEKPLVPQLAYNAAFPGFATTDIFGQGYMDSLNITGTGQPVARIVTTLPGAGYTVAPSVQIVPAQADAPRCLPPPRGLTPLARLRSSRQAPVTPRFLPLP